MAFYLFLSERHGSGVGSRWAFMGLAVKLGVSVSHPSPRYCPKIDTLFLLLPVQMGLRKFCIFIVLFLDHQ